jgi:hypothetical protein
MMTGFRGKTASDHRGAKGVIPSLNAAVHTENHRFSIIFTPVSFQLAMISTRSVSATRDLVPHR